VYSSIIVAEFREDVRVTIPAIAERLKDSDWYVRSVAIELLSRLAAQGMCVSITLWWVCSSMFIAEFREDVRITIPAIVEGLNVSDWYVRLAAIEGVSRLAVQGMC